MVMMDPPDRVDTPDGHSGFLAFPSLFTLSLSGKYTGQSVVCILIMVPFPHWLCKMQLQTRRIGTGNTVPDVRFVARVVLRKGSLLFSQYIDGKLLYEIEYFMRLVVTKTVF